MLATTLVTVFQEIYSFSETVFGDVSASAIAAILPLRYIFGTFLPVAAPYMFARLRYE